MAAFAEEPGLIHDQAAVADQLCSALAEWQRNRRPGAARTASHRTALNRRGGRDGHGSGIKTSIVVALLGQWATSPGHRAYGYILLYTRDLSEN